METNYLFIFSYVMSADVFSTLQEPVDYDNSMSHADSSTQEEDDIMESDMELDNSDVVEPDNDPPQKVAMCVPIN